jgi:hypothetical protein
VSVSIGAAGIMRHIKCKVYRETSDTCQRKKLRTRLYSVTITDRGGDFYTRKRIRHYASISRQDVEDMSLHNHHLFLRASRLFFLAFGTEEIHGFSLSLSPAAVTVLFNTLTALAKRKRKC